MGAAEVLTHGGVGVMLCRITAWQTLFMQYYQACAFGFPLVGTATRVVADTSICDALAPNTGRQQVLWSSLVGFLAACPAF